MSVALHRAFVGLLKTGYVALLWCLAPSAHAAIPQLAQLCSAPGDTLPQPLVPKQPLGYNQYDAEMHREGLWIISYPNGLPRQWDTYADDRLNGPSLEWSPSGQLLVVRYYKNGLLDSAELLLDHSGQWVQYAQYRAGQWHGTVTTFYGNGKPKEQRTYEHGVLSGVSTWFYDNGNPMAQYPYESGKKQGRAQYFYDNGVLEKNEWFEDNLSVRWETFDLDGKQTGSGKTKKNP